MWTLEPFLSRGRSPEIGKSEERAEELRLVLQRARMYRDFLKNERFYAEEVGTNVGKGKVSVIFVDLF